MKNYHQEKANACDCVNVPWSDLHLMKISRDESNPVQRIIEMFADFQICQREQKEAQNELEAFRKALNFIEYIFSQLGTLFSFILEVNLKNKSE